MKRLAVLLALVPIAAACGATVEESAPKPPADTAVFLARTAGAAGPVTGYDAASLGRRFELPGGIRAADGSAYFAMGAGELRRFSPNTGVELQSYAVDGAWKLSGVSATGRWAALTRGKTEVLVFDTESGATAHRLTLRGNFLVETVSADGTFLFLQQNFVNGSYAVRGYDLSAGQMLPGSLATKGATVLMEGVAAQTVASPDGRWLLTLYVDTKKNHAFVHALNLIDRIPLCIEMPPCRRCTVAQLRRWALALAPDGRTLFAANPDVGRIAEIHLPTKRLIYQARFSPSPGAFETRAAVAPNGGRLVFTNGEAVWSYDTHRGYAEKLRVDGNQFADLGISSDSRKLYLARLGAAPVALEL